ncbi:MAG: PDDEXK nuclease domain-containing protein [Methanomassiliicoccaceae archaeon]|nr:PDDEXK nuclease domain-containing protein [Methanomassiliicoccaceae archaeon]
MTSIDVTESEVGICRGISKTIEGARSKAFYAVNFAMVEAYWDIGRQIEYAIGERAEYGKGLLQYLAEQLTAKYGRGFTERNLRAMRQFFMMFPNRHTLRPELNWSHYRLLMKIDLAPRREFYMQECIESAWSVRQLERQINSSSYERMLSTKKSGQKGVKNKKQTPEPKTDQNQMIKDPYILEFLDVKDSPGYHESDLEQVLIDKLQEFLLELGKGFSFVGRQKRITTDEGRHYYIDLVFYNYILKCFVVVDLTTGELTYQDIGQIDFYVRLFDDIVKQKDDNPTIGIVLCSEKDKNIVKYSVLSDKENLFASKYMTYLPSEEELKKELDRGRENIERRKKLDEPPND